jgi:hypothetical protein
MNLHLKQSYRENLSVQIFMAFTVLIFSISLAFSALTVYHQKKALIVELEDTGKLLIKTLAYSCRIGVFSENTELLQTPVTGVFQHENVLEVSVFNTKGTTILQKVARGDATILKSSETGSTPPLSLQFSGNRYWFGLRTGKTRWFFGQRWFLLMTLTCRRCFSEKQRVKREKIKYSAFFA